jgi:hypothetical protein
MSCKRDSVLGVNTLIWWVGNVGEAGGVQAANLPLAIFGLAEHTSGMALLATGAGNKVGSTIRMLPWLGDVKYLPTVAAALADRWPLARRLVLRAGPKPDFDGILARLEAEGAATLRAARAVPAAAAIYESDVFVKVERWQSCLPRNWKQMTYPECIATLDGATSGLAAPPRLVFDDAAHTVTLDGVPHQVQEPKAYAVYKVIAQPPADMPYIPKAKIRSLVRGVAGQKTIPRLIKTLPNSLRTTVRPCSGRGYCVALPRLNKEKRREVDHK